MCQNNTLLEREIKRVIVKLHQEIFGRGPEQLLVKVEQNICVFSCVKTLTPMERFLLEIDGGVEQVVKLRGQISEIAIEKLRQEIEILCNVKFISTTAEISVEMDTIFGAILFSWNKSRTCDLANC